MYEIEIKVGNFFKVKLRGRIYNKADEWRWKLRLIEPSHHTNFETVSGSCKTIGRAELMLKKSTIIFLKNCWGKKAFPDLERKKHLRWIKRLRRQRDENQYRGKLAGCIHELNEQYVQADRSYVGAEKEGGRGVIP